jgi:hypothetical protein
LEGVTSVASAFLLVALLLGVVFAGDEGTDLTSFFSTTGIPSMVFDVSAP